MSGFLSLPFPSLRSDGGENLRGKTIGGQGKGDEPEGWRRWAGAFGALTTRDPAASRSSRLLYSRCSR